MATFLSFLVVALLLGIVPAQNVSPPTSDVDLRAHLETLGKTLDDATVAVGNRERVALDMAATLDRAALSTPNLESRRAYWAEAATTLDTFSERNLGHPMSQSFRVQATVYLWARARTWCPEETCC